MVPLSNISRLIRLAGFEDTVFSGVLFFGILLGPFFAVSSLFLVVAFLCILVLVSEENPRVVAESSVGSFSFF